MSYFAASHFGVSSPGLSCDAVDSSSGHCCSIQLYLKFATFFFLYFVVCVFFLRLREIASTMNLLENGICMVLVRCYPVPVTVKVPAMYNM